MKRTAQEISQYVGGELRGDGGTAIDSIASLKNAGPRDLSYADEKFNSEVAASRAGCVLVRSGALPSRTVILVKNPKLAFARAAAWLLAETEREIGIHPSATVAPTATIGEHVKIGAGAVLESGVFIGDNTTIEAGCYIGKNTIIGNHSTLYPRVVI